jgi:hypothetical protein
MQPCEAAAPVAAAGSVGGVQWPFADSREVLTGVAAAAHAHGHVLAAGAPALVASRWPRDFNLVAPDELLREHRPYEQSASAVAFFGRHLPDACVPHAVLEPLLLEEARPARAARAAALQGCRLVARRDAASGWLLVFTAAGRAGEVVGVTALAPRAAAADEEGEAQAPPQLAAQLVGAVDCGAPVLQLALRDAPPPADGGGDDGGPRPLLVLARCAFKICLLVAAAAEPSDDRRGFGDEPEAAAEGGAWRWRVRMLAEARMPCRVTCAAWNRHLLEAAVVTEDGRAWVVAPDLELLQQHLDGEAGEAAGAALEPRAVATPQQLRLGRALAAGARMACEYGAHPRHLLVACGRRLVRIVLQPAPQPAPQGPQRGAGGSAAAAVDRVLKLPRGESFCSLAPWSGGRGGDLTPAARGLAAQLLAAATTRRLLLLDLRQPQSPLLSWDCRAAAAADPPAVLQLLPAPPPAAPQPAAAAHGGREGAGEDDDHDDPSLLGSPGNNWQGASQMPSQMFAPATQRVPGDEDWARFPATQASQAPPRFGEPQPSSQPNHHGGGRGGGEQLPHQHQHHQRRRPESEVRGMIVGAGLALGQVLTASFTAHPGAAADRHGAAGRAPFGGVPPADAGWRLSCAVTVRAAGPVCAVKAGSVAATIEGMGRLQGMRRERALLYECSDRWVVWWVKGQPGWHAEVATGLVLWGWSATHHRLLQLLTHDITKPQGGARGVPRRPERRAARARRRGARPRARHGRGARPVRRHAAAAAAAACRASGWRLVGRTGGGWGAGAAAEVLF